MERMDRWREDGIYERAEASGLELAEVAAAGARFLDCRLSSSLVDGGDLEAATWRGGGLRQVRFMGVRMPRSTWHGVELTDCSLAGVDLSLARLTRVTVTGGVLQAVNLRRARLEDVVFEDCVLRDVDLGSATLRRVRFPGCRIERIDLTAMTARETDLRGARLDIARGVDRLRGTVIDHGQLIDLAPTLAAHLGLEVRTGD
jgi:uncharacterized protein YjbI with pentapeptide repeats